jgi:hypothetical protein
VVYFCFGFRILTLILLEKIVAAARGASQGVENVGKADSNFISPQAQ